MYSQLYVSISKVVCPVLAISSTLSDLLLKHNNIKHTTCKAIEIHYILSYLKPSHFHPPFLWILNAFLWFGWFRKELPNKNINESSIHLYPSVSRSNRTFGVPWCGPSSTGSLVWSFFGSHIAGASLDDGWDSGWMLGASNRRHTGYLFLRLFSIGPVFEEVPERGGV